MTKNIEIIRDEVTNLYKFRDEYLTNHGTEEAHRKSDDVKEKLQLVLNIIDDLKENVNADCRGEVHFLRGKALNITSDYSPDAETELGKATKFNLHSAWNELGECLYKKGDLTGARTCFERAISISEESKYFRNMSMVMRSLPCKNHKEREENISKGLEYARQALKDGLSDGHAWLVLGNSYLSSFFTVEARLEVLKNSKAAYAKAESDKLAVLLPELHFNKSQVQWYEEEYSKALESLWRAQELEPSWKEVKERYDQSWNFLSRLAHLTKSCGQLNHRRINNLISDIKSNQLGPYENGGSSVTDNKKPTVIAVKQLCEGPNQDKIIQGKVVCTLIPETGIPFSFCLLDKERSCISVTVYNWANGSEVKIGDSVAIVAPVFKKHEVLAKHKNETIQFNSVRVAVPVMLVVNKRRVTASQVAAATVVSYQKQE